MAPEPIAQSDSAPCGGTFQTECWQTGETIVDEHVIVLPEDYAGDAVSLATGLYDWRTLTRLTATGGDVLLGDRLRLQTIPVNR